MDAQSVEKHILEYAIKGMPSYKNTVDTRKTYISTLYNYLSEIIEVILLLSIFSGAI